VPRKIDIRFELEAGSVPANGWDGLTRAIYEREGSTMTLEWFTNAPSNPHPNRRPTQFAQVTNDYTLRLVLAR
jgi:hypothetical protein